MIFIIILNIRLFICKFIFDEKIDTVFFNIILQHYLNIPLLNSSVSMPDKRQKNGL